MFNKVKFDNVKKRNGIVSVLLPLLGMGAVLGTILAVDLTFDRTFRIRTRIENRTEILREKNLTFNLMTHEDFKKNFENKSLFEIKKNNEKIIEETIENVLYLQKVKGMNIRTIDEELFGLFLSQSILSKQNSMIKNEGNNSNNINFSVLYDKYQKNGDGILSLYYIRDKYITKEEEGNVYYIIPNARYVQNIKKITRFLAYSTLMVPYIDINFEENEKIDDLWLRLQSISNLELQQDYVGSKSLKANF